MLRKRNRSVQKQQNMVDSHFQSESLGQKHRTNSFFTIPGVLAGFNPWRPSDSDAVRSPNSPLDFKVLSNLGYPFRAPGIPHNVQQRSWDCNNVGLSIINSLQGSRTGKVLRSSDSKTILFGSEMRPRSQITKRHMDSFDTPNSMPKNYAIFPGTQKKSFPFEKENSNILFEIGDTPAEAETFGKIRSCSLDSGSSLLLLTGSGDRRPILKNMGSPLGSGSPTIEKNADFHSDIKLTSNPFSTGSCHGLIGSLSATEIELSEDYTRVTAHGPNPKTTHIFGDCVLECHTKDLPNLSKKNEQSEAEGVMKCCGTFNSFASDDFLSFCCYCKKKLEGKDIYMYRGEKAFCSLSCRLEEILIEEEIEKTEMNAAETTAGFYEEPSVGMFIPV